MDSLVGGILKYSSLRYRERKKQQVDLNIILSEVIDGITLTDNTEILVANELPVLICERAHIKQIFEHLLSNAIKHGRKFDGQIEIACVREDSFWKFSVSDNGPGIEKKYFGKIFRIFQTLSSRERTGNTGIGLSIVKKIVELNAGSVRVESEPGKGSTFSFTLPIRMTARNAGYLAADTVC